MTNGTTPKDIFLCHTNADKEWVERLAQRLEAEAVGDRKISVWFDKWDIDGGENILSKIEEGLKASRFVAVVLSPAMTKAPWPTLEWQSQIFDDPSGKRARILPLLRHVFDPITAEPIEIPLPLKIVKRYDFSNDRTFEDEFASLLRRIRGERPARGSESLSQGEEFARGPETPELLTDSLVSNLLPVTALPATIFSDECSESDPLVIIAKVKPDVPWLLSGGRLFSFCDPASKPIFRSVLTRRLQKSERTVDWLASDVQAPRAIRLLNDGLRKLCRSLNIWLMPESREQYYFAIPKRIPRTFQWSASSRPRTLAKMAAVTEGEPFGVHHAARLRFINFGTSVYLLIQPGWTFTSDGVNPLPGRQLGLLSMRWGGRERNAAVLRNTLMWGLVLSSGKSEIAVDMGSAILRLAAVPAHSEIGVGVKADAIQLAKILGGEGGGEMAAVEESGDELDAIAEFRDLRTEGDEEGERGATDAEEDS